MAKRNENLYQQGENLVREFMQSGNPAVKSKIVSVYAPLIKHVVGRFNVSHSTTLSKDDLYQFGIFGLLKALERYRPDVGVPFKAYAYKRIYGEVVDSLRKEGMLGRDKYEQVKNLEKTIRTLTASLGHEPAVEEVCLHMGISENEYHALVSTSQMVYTTSLNTKISGEEGEYIYRIDTLTDDGQESPEELAVKSNLKENLKGIINDLPERQKLILALYFFEELTLSDIGRIVELSEARISQILNKTLLEIRVNLNT